MTGTTLPRMQENLVGPMLRDWRTRRRRSQLSLALDAGISTRHLSFVETGRARPSAEMVLTLAAELEVPLRERNHLLLAAGYAPQYAARSIDDPELSPIRDALGHVLSGHEPFPALAVDHHWNLVSSNGSLGMLIEGVAPELLVPPANTMRIALHPDGMASQIVNLGEYRAHLLHKVRRAVEVTGDPTLVELLDELRAYPGPPEEEHVTHLPGRGEDVMVGLRVRTADGDELSFFSTITTFGTAIDITVAELSIEAFFPADVQTATALSAGAVS